MPPHLTGLTKLTLETAPTVCHECIWWQTRGRRNRLLLAHPRSRYRNGVYRRRTTTMHVSPGLGTTFVPFRFFARPEATELVLRSR